MLGRRSAARVPETQTSLRDLGWVLNKDALQKRVDIGVERLPDALRFVAIAESAANTGTAQRSMDRLSVPRSEPRLVEIAWTSAGRAERRVVEATPERTVMIDASATDIRFITLAGDEYELRLRSEHDDGRPHC